MGYAQRIELDAEGRNKNGVLMCECKPYAGPHAYEPGEWCSPEHVLPIDARLAAAEQQRDRLLEAVRTLRHACRRRGGSNLPTAEALGEERDAFDALCAVAGEIEGERP